VARLFKQSYTKRDANGRTVKGKTRRWYVEFRNSDGKRKRVPGYTDKAATVQLAARLERLADRESEGMVDRFAEHVRRPLSEHVADWRKALIDKGGTRTHADLSMNRVAAVLAGVNAQLWPELKAERVVAHLADRRRAGLSAESSNHYLRAAKGFSRWLWRNRRAPEHALAGLDALNTAVDRRHARRALGDDELACLLRSTESAPKRFSLTGPDRARLYRLAVETGLRVGELRSLTWASFDLDGKPATVTVGAAYSKHRRDDTLPMRPSTASFLARWRNELGDVDRGDHLFRRITDKTSSMIRADLRLGRARWIRAVQDRRERRERRASEFLLSRDSAGRVADFHALRHTFITNLARGGVHPKIAQQLARHSTIGLTMDRYTHTVLGDLAGGLDALPDLDAAASDREALRATGTYDVGDGLRSERLTALLTQSLPKSLPTRAAQRSTDRSQTCAFDHPSAHEPSSGKPMIQGASCTSRHRTAPHSVTDLALGRGGVEPPTHGFSVRCSTN